MMKNTNKNKNKLFSMEKKEGRVETMLNKGFQLHTLCGVDVAVIITDPVSGRVFTYPSDRSQVVRIIERYRSSGHVDKAKKKRKLIQKPKISVPNKIQRTFDQDRSELAMGLGFGGPNVVHHDPELGVIGFGAKPEPRGLEIDQWPLLEAGSSLQEMFDPEFLYSMSIDDGYEFESEGLDGDDQELEWGVMGFGEEDVEFEVGEQRSEAAKVEFDVDDDEFWNELPQIDDPPRFTPTCYDCNSFGLESFEYWQSCSSMC